MQLLVGMITKYQKRISGPLLDRIDIHIEVPRVEYDKLSDQRLGEASGSIQLRVEAAREIQRQRFARKPYTQRESQAGAAAISPAPTCNADMRPGAHGDEPASDVCQGLPPGAQAVAHHS